MANSMSQIEKLKMAITSAHTRAFSKDNLITERVPLEESNIWNNAISEIANYLQQNNSKLTDEFNQLRNISNELLNTLKVNFGSYIAPAITDAAKKQTGVNISTPGASAKIDKAKININGLQQSIARLAAQEKIAKEIPVKLASKWFLSASDKDLIPMINQLALTLELTLAKLPKDLNKLKAFIQAK